jgi:hypothetical protein
VALLLTCTSIVAAHTGQPNRHWTTTNFSGAWDYYQIYCFEPGWPNGITGTSANNVANGIGRWNNRTSAGGEIDFRYGRATVNCDQIAEDVDVRYEAMEPDKLGKMQYFPPVDIDGAGHLKHALLLIAARSDVYYGGCCPTWQGSSDSRYHVSTVSAHEAGHGAILVDEGFTSGCCESHLNETSGKHSVYSADVMYRYIYAGSLKYPTTREIDWLYRSYGHLD